MRKAIAYVSDIILGSSGEVISRESQKEALKAHAVDNGIEIVAWFEDEAYCEELRIRPGISRLLECSEECDCVLVERVWALSRRWKEVQSFLDELSRKGRKLEASTLMWDCVSQAARNFYTRNRLPQCKMMERPAQEAHEGVKVAKPSALHFAQLHRAPKHA